MSAPVPRRRTYLDHAATTWPKPDSVIEAACNYANNIGAAAGRGAYDSARAADDLLSRTRRQIGTLIDAADPNSIAFTPSGTHSLNMAISGLLKPGDHVVTTAIEHNSVLRPLAYLERTRDIKWTVVQCDGVGRISPQSIESAIVKETKLIVVTHGSNVTGALVDISAIGDLVRKHRIPLLVDAAQTLGYIPISVRDVGISILAAPGHKGLWGLTGTGILYVAPNLHDRLDPPLKGGTGRDSELLDAEFRFPNGIEVGNHNMPGIASLSAGIAELVKTDIQERYAQLEKLSERLVGLLSEHSELRLIRPNAHEQPLPVFSIVAPWAEPHELASIMDASFGIEVRSGLHCAGLIHQRLGTSGTGTLRISLGHSTTEHDIDELEAALQELAAGIS